MNLEQLLTRPEGFGITGASRAQRAVMRIMTGEPLGELARAPEVAEMVGGAHAIGMLPTRAPRMIVFGAAVRTGKSTIVAAKGLRNAYLGDCSDLPPGEIPRVPIVSVRLDQARETLAKLVGALTNSPTLSGLLVREPTADSVLVRNRSGRPVEIKMVAGSRAGQTLVSRWCLGAIFDEAPRMLGQADGVVNLDDALTAIRARMRPGAQIDLVGSLWAPRGPVYELIQNRFGKPGEDLVVIVANGPQLRPELYTPEYCEQIRTEDDRAFESDVMSRFADPEDALLPSVDVAAAIGALRSENPENRQNYVAIMDPATRGNGWTLVLLTSTAPERYECVLAREWIGSRAKPLKATAVLGEMAEALRPYGVTDVWTDQWGFDFLTEIAELSESGLSFAPMARDDDTAGKTLGALLGKRALALPDNRVLRSDLIAVRRRPRQQGGSQIILPNTADGRHCDFAAALLLGMQVLPAPPDVEQAPTMSSDEADVIAALTWRREHPSEYAASKLLGGF